MKGGLVPLYGFVQGDVLGILVLAHEHDTIGEVAHSLAQAASMRVTPFERPVVFEGGRQLDSQATVTACGLTALDRIDLMPGGTR
jgi:hypothetical protein